MLRLFLALVVLGVGACASGSGGKSGNKSGAVGIEKTGDPAVLILYISDLHSQLRPGKDGLGGFASLKTWIDHEKAQAGPKTDVLVLAGGDLIGKGSLPCQITWDNDCVPLLRDLGIEYSALGNYELYNKPQYLAPLVKTSKIKFLGANVSSISGSKTRQKSRELWSREPVFYKGKKSGVGFWLSSWTMPADISNYKVQAFPSGSDWSRLKSKLGGKEVLFLTHQEFDQDQSFLKEACLSLNGVTPEGTEKASQVLGLLKANDHYPKRVEKLLNCGNILEPGAFGTFGLRVLVKSNGDMPSEVSSDFVEINPMKFKPDSGMKAKIDMLYSKHAPDADEVLVEIPTAKSKMDLALFMADAFRYKTRADVAIVNTGYVKHGIEAGVVTKEDFFLSMPHKNQLKGLDWSVKNLEQSLCKSSMRTMDSQLDHGSGLAISGAKLENIGTPQCKLTGLRKKSVKVVVDSYLVSRSKRWLGKELKHKVFGFGVDTRRVSMLHLKNKKNLDAQK